MAPDRVDETLDLLNAARQGDAGAVDRLFARYMPDLRQWASGRLPHWARDMADTHDLVQETVFRVFRKLEGFEYRGEGALRAYLRQALLNRIRNEVRRAHSQPEQAPLDSGIEDPAPSPHEVAVGKEAIEKYETALARLSVTDRESLIARFEMGLTYQEIATMLQKPSSDAVRMAVARALVRLTEEMGRG